MVKVPTWPPRFILSALGKTILNSYTHKNEDNDIQWVWYNTRQKKQDMWTIKYLKQSAIQWKQANLYKLFEWSAWIPGCGQQNFRIFLSSKCILIIDVWSWDWIQQGKKYQNPSNPTPHMKNAIKWENMMCKTFIKDKSVIKTKFQRLKSLLAFQIYFRSELNNCNSKNW